MKKPDDEKTFKNIVHDDLNVFINVEEFAEEHELNGKMLMAVVVNDAMQPRSISRPNENFGPYDAVYSKLATVHLKTEDLDEIPREGMIMVLDGKEYHVTAYCSDMGMSTINLEAFETC